MATALSPLTLFSDTRPRAPLGNKTTNAKARPVQSVAVKDRVSEIEKAQLKSTVSQKPKQRSTELVASKIVVQPDKEAEEEEPEYAPPPPAALPYESDVLPEGGLTFEGLARKNLFKGYYEHFYNPLDENGVSRREKEFSLEMEIALEQAVKNSERESDTLDWSVTDVPETAKLFNREMTQPQTQPHRGAGLEATGKRSAPSITSRRAASALAIHPAPKRPAPSRPIATTHSTTKPLRSALSGNKSARTTNRQSPPDVITAGEAASRTTLGYNKGRTASSLIRPQKNDDITQSRSAKSAPQTDDLLCRAASPGCLQLTNDDHDNIVNSGRPRFMSIFYDDDDSDLLSFRGPTALLEEEAEEEFVLKLDV